MRTLGEMCGSPPLLGKAFNHFTTNFTHSTINSHGILEKVRVWRIGRTRSLMTRIRLSTSGTCSFVELSYSLNGNSGKSTWNPLSAYTFITLLISRTIDGTVWSVMYSMVVKAKYLAMVTKKGNRLMNIKSITVMQDDVGWYWNQIHLWYIRSSPSGFPFNDGTLGPYRSLAISRSRGVTGQLCRSPSLITSPKSDYEGYPTLARS